MVPSETVSTIEVTPLGEQQQHAVRVLLHHPRQRAAQGVPHGIADVRRVLDELPGVRQGLEEQWIAGIGAAREPAPGQAHREPRGDRTPVDAPKPRVSIDRLGPAHDSARRGVQRGVGSGRRYIRWHRLALVIDAARRVRRWSQNHVRDLRFP